MKPSHHPSPGPNRPSLANTSTSASTTDSPRNWEESDIRSDLAAGWGNNNNGGAVAGVPPVEPPANDWGWKLTTQAVRPLPPFYPLDPRSTRKLLLATQPQPGDGMSDVSAQSPQKMDKNLHSIEAISNRISNACQHLSIQVEWDNGIPCATLLTMEMVEMVISMYLGGDEGGMMMGGKQSGMVHSIPPTPGPQVLLIELQRRKGDIVAFYNYRRALLDAAEGKFDVAAYDKTDGLGKPGGRDRGNAPRATLNRPSLAKPKAMRPPSLSANDADTMFASLKKEIDSFDKTDEDPFKSANDEHNDIVDKALEALNIAASLIKKDRVDAQRLGMESLVLLTDPLRAGFDTAKIASRVVLLGTAREDLAMGIDEDDLDALFDESAGLGIRETILEMIMGDEFAGKMGKDDIHDTEIDREFRDTLFNLGLSVLSNALHTLGEGSESIHGPSQHDTSLNRSYNHDDEDDRKPSPSPPPNRRRAATEPVNRPSDLNVPRRFIDDTTESFGCDVLSALIRILGQAKMKPHDAYHSARCLDVLFKGGGNVHRARARRDLDAKRIISAALEVGARSHAKLESASRATLVSLVTDDELSMEEEEKTEMEQQQEEKTDEEMENVEDTRKLP
ncbi:hypothetical protein ACHAWO_005019 [Cyclotella atomus]|uniref:Uncharacterized protein n=1 Tax=Cyclotella atomus TaxID=382360 RepID=A0ABD3PTE5_9STRA